MKKPPDVKEKEPPTIVNASDLANGVVFGIRGCLTTLAGFLLGIPIGVELTVWLTVGPRYNWTEDGISLLLAFAGGSLGATVGALCGLIIGTKRR